MKYVVDPLYDIPDNLLQILNLHIAIEHQQWVRYRHVYSFHSPICPINFAGCIVVLLAGADAEVVALVVLVNVVGRSKTIECLAWSLILAAWNYCGNLMCVGRRTALSLWLVAHRRVVVVKRDITWVYNATRCFCLRLVLDHCLGL